MQSPESVKIVERFFEVIYDLKKNRNIHGKQSFTREYGINYGNFYQLEKNKSRDMFQLEWLKILVDDFFVNSNWLLTGRGEMYLRIPQKQIGIKNKKHIFYNNSIKKIAK